MRNLESGPRELEDYRDTIAEKLKEIRESDGDPKLNRARAQGYLEAKRESPEYEDERELHKTEAHRARVIKEIKKHWKDWLLNSSKDGVNKEEWTTIVQRLQDATNGLIDKGIILDANRQGIWSDGMKEEDIARYDKQAVDAEVDKLTEAYRVAYEDFARNYDEEKMYVSIRQEIDDVDADKIGFGFYGDSVIDQFGTTQVMAARKRREDVPYATAREQYIRDTIPFTAPRYSISDKERARLKKKDKELLDARRQNQSNFLEAHRSVEKKGGE